MAQMSPENYEKLPTPKQVAFLTKLVEDNNHKLAVEDYPRTRAEYGTLIGQLKDRYASANA